MFNTNEAVRVRCLSVAVLVIAGMAGAAWTDEVTQDDGKTSLVNAPSFTLPNTEDGLTRVKWPREKIVFLTIGDQGGSEFIQAWAKAIHDAYGDRLEYVPVAMLKAVSDNMKLAVETIIKTQHKGVLMDWSGVVADKYRARPGAANVYLIDSDGTVLAEYHTAVSDAGLAEVDALIVAAESDSEES